LKSIAFLMRGVPFRYFRLQKYQREGIKQYLVPSHFLNLKISRWFASLPSEELPDALHDTKAMINHSDHNSRKEADGSIHSSTKSFSNKRVPE
jgi:hypothetical protein